MKNLLLTLILVLPLVLPAQENQQKATTLPSVTLKTLNGENVNTATLSNNGKPMIISFWALWCKPCIKELTTIADVYDEWVEETGVKLVAVSIDDARSSARVKPMVEGKGWEYEVLLDPNGDFKRAMNITVIPHTFLVDGNGKVVWQHASFSEGSELELLELVRKLNRGESLEAH